jgi:hypothetical protein
MNLKFCRNFAGEAHSLKIEKILFQGTSEYQKVMVFQVNEVSFNFEITITLILYYVPYLYFKCITVHDVFCSHQRMARFLFWTVLFSSQKGTNVPTKKWSLIFLFALYRTLTRSSILLWVQEILVYVYIACLVTELVYFVFPVIFPFRFWLLVEVMEESCEK